MNCYMQECEGPHEYVEQECMPYKGSNQAGLLMLKSWESSSLARGKRLEGENGVTLIWSLWRASDSYVCTLLYVGNNLVKSNKTFLKDATMKQTDSYRAKSNEVLELKDLPGLQITYLQR